MSEKQVYPFKELGQKLKSLRQTSKETVDDVSGAVEIDPDKLISIEKGLERPEEEIMQLLVSHFGVNDLEATDLWALAKYDIPQKDDRDMLQDGGDRNMVLVMAIDPRITYSDTLHISANPSGIVLNFSQGGDNSRPVIAARVGMSHEQARNVLKALSDVLERPELKQTPPFDKKEGKPKV